MKLKIISILLGLSLMSCQSPLLDHIQAPEEAPSESPAQPSEKTSSESEAGAGSTADCDLEFKTSGLCAVLTWVKEPTSTKERGSFTLKFWDPAKTTDAGPYVNPKKKVEVYLWMGVHGHGSAPVSMAQSQDASGSALDGEYTISDVLFVMKGAWEIYVELKDSKGKSVDKTYLSYSTVF